jgi:hypothetical protein
MAILTERSHQRPGEWYLVRHTHSRLLPSYAPPSACTSAEACAGFLIARHTPESTDPSALLVVGRRRG